MKKWIFLVLSILCVIVGFLHIPILCWCGVDIFALRGILIFTWLPTIIIFSIPLAIFVERYSKKSKDKSEKWTKLTQILTNKLKNANIKTLIGENYV